MPAVPPNPLLTDRGGASQRMRVDNGSTGFWAGREFRTFYEFTLAANEVLYFKVSSPIDYNVEGLGIQVDVGDVALEAFATIPGDAVVPTGNFDLPLPIIGTNRMLSRPKDANGNYYAPQITIMRGNTGASFTGGMKLDIVSTKTTGNSNQASTQDAAVAGERGLPPGEVWLKLTNRTNATATGVMKARWEDRP